MRGMVSRPLGSDPVATLPDGSKASLPIDQTPYLAHNRNSHGWPPNNMQEYLNTESAAVRDMMLQQMQLHDVASDSLSDLSDAQRCALTPSRRAQSLSEFMSDQSRLDSVRQSFVDAAVNAADAVKAVDVVDDKKDS